MVVVEPRVFLPVLYVACIVEVYMWLWIPNLVPRNQCEPFRVFLKNSASRKISRDLTEKNGQPEFEPNFFTQPAEIEKQIRLRVETHRAIALSRTFSEYSALKSKTAPTHCDTAPKSRNIVVQPPMLTHGNQLLFCKTALSMFCHNTRCAKSKSLHAVYTIFLYSSHETSQSFSIYTCLPQGLQAVLTTRHAVINMRM